MTKHTKTTLAKVESIFEQLGYTVRYAKGRFNSGYAVVEDKKIAVVNKYFDTHGRASTLIDILSGMRIDPTSLDEKSQKVFRKLLPPEPDTNKPDQEEQTDLDEKS